MAGKFFVVQGAVCSCQFGASPDKLKVLTNTTEYINDDGQQKLIASTRDIGQPFEAKTFGACKVTRSACKPAITAWQEFYEKVTLTNGGKILTDASKAVCSVGGSPCIKINFHGQTASVSSAQTDAAAPAMAVLNPLAPKPVAEGKEAPKVKKIILALTGRTKPETVPSKDKGGVATAKVRVDESLKFEVTEYWNKAKADPAKVSWKIVAAHAFEGEQTLHSEIGPVLEIKLDKPGKYRVLAFGNPGSAADESCAIDLVVAYNGIKSVDASGGTARAVAVRGGTEYRLRRGVPTELHAVFDFEPTDAERSATVLQIADGGGSEVAGGGDRVTFTPANTAATYTVTASFTAADGSVQRATKTFKTEANGVVSIASPEGEKVRPGTTMTFRVSQMVYNSLDDLTPGEVKNIKWQLNGREVGTGTSISLAGAQYFSRPGQYVVEAYAATANAWNAKTGRPGGSNEKDDWRFEVAANAITAVDGPTQWIVGKRYNLTAKTSMPYDPRLDGPIAWTSPRGAGNANGTSAEGVHMDAKGTGVITARLGSSSKSLTVTAEALKLKRWCFVDSQGQYKAKAGWGETLKAVIESPGASGEKLHLHLLEYDNPGDSNYLKDLGEVTFNEEGLAEVSFKTDDIKEALNKLYFEGDFYDVYFAVEKGSMSFDGAKEFGAEGKTLLFPGAESNRSGSEVGKYVFIDGKPNVVEVRYLDGKGKRIYRVLPYGEKVRMHVQTMNLAGQKVHASIYLNLAQGEDKPVLQDKEFTVAADETLKIDIDTGQLKGAVAASDYKKIAMFYVVLKEADGDKFVYPQDLSLAQTLDLKKVNFYHHLKLSEARDEVNQRAAANAPAVIGEPLDAGVAAGPCQCKQTDLIWGNKVSCEFRRKVIEIAGRLGKDPNLLMAAMALETGATFSPTAGKGTSYVGLIQFGDDAARSVGTTRDALLRMTAVEQLTYVEKYLEKKKDKLNTLTDFYLSILMPVDVGRGKEPNHVVFDNEFPLAYKSDGKTLTDLSKSRHYGYRQNPTFFQEEGERDRVKQGGGRNYDGPGKTYIWEIEKAIKKWYDNGELQRNITGRCAMGGDAQPVLPQSGSWHEPVDNPQITMYMQSGGYWPKYAAFGLTRRQTRATGVHQGLDLFAPPTTPIYACVSGEIVYGQNTGSGYGNMIILKADEAGKEAFIARRREYVLRYENDGEKAQGDGFNTDGDIYFRYGHLGSIIVASGHVEAGKPIGTTGTSGVPGGTCGPHVHFEIASARSPGGGLSNRCNAGFYVYYKNEDQMSEAEKVAQLAQKNKGRV